MTTVRAQLTKKTSNQTADSLSSIIKSAQHGKITSMASKNENSFNSAFCQGDFTKKLLGQVKQLQNENAGLKSLVFDLQEKNEKLARKFKEFSEYAELSQEGKKFCSIEEQLNSQATLECCFLEDMPVEKDSTFETEETFGMKSSVSTASRESFPSLEEASNFDEKLKSLSSEFRSTISKYELQMDRLVSSNTELETQLQSSKAKYLDLKEQYCGLMKTLLKKERGY